MAEAVGIDKEKPKEAVTVAVKMLKGEWGGGGWGWGQMGVGQGWKALSRMFLLWHVNSMAAGGQRAHS